MTDAEQWARSWFGGLIRNDAPVPVALQDHRSAPVPPAELPEALRELRRPVADGVPKHGRYAVVYEQPWSGQDAVWMEAAEYSYGMFGARFVLVQPIRRGQRGELLPLGDLVELTDAAVPAAPGHEPASVRELVGTGVARARRVWAGRSGATPTPGGFPVRRSARQRAGAALGVARELPRRVTASPAAVVVALWSVLVLVGVVSAVSLMSGDDASAKPTRSAGRVVAAAPPAAAVPAAAPVRPAPAKPAPVQPPPAKPEPATPGPDQARGDLGVQVPISRPSCDGAYGVIIASVTRPDAYQRDVRNLLARYSGSSYLLAEQTCPSLRARTAGGDSIYAVYYGPYSSLGNACATRNRIGAGSYVRKLDTTSPRGLIHC
jgi:serine/threonine-protein kinase